MVFQSFYLSNIHTALYIYSLVEIPSRQNRLRRFMIVDERKRRRNSEDEKTNNDNAEYSNSTDYVKNQSKKYE